MKSAIKAIILAVSAICLLSSCHKDLDITYGMVLNSGNMWQDPSDLEQSVPGIYQRLRNYFSANECNVFYLGEVRVGDSMWGPSLESKVSDNFKIACRHNTMNGSNTIGWSGLYSAIDQANAVLKYADRCKASASVVSWAKAQAYFARAFSYFYVARIWGYAPINLLPVESPTQAECYPEQRTPVEILDQVSEDIDSCFVYASALGTSKYLGTKEALLMLKAEYSLWMYTVMGRKSKSYVEAAETALSPIVTSSCLLLKYSDVFDRTNKVNSEVVFALNNTAASTAGYQIYFCHPANLIATQYQCKNGGPVPISSTQWWAFSQPFLDALKSAQKAGDTRVATNLGCGPYATDGHEITWCNKLLGDMSVQPVKLDNDLLYYRLAQAVLMYAEAKYWNEDYEGANAALNIIAKRAYGINGKYTSTKAEDVLANIVNEYTYEFPAEGVIWWAYIRTGKIWGIEPNNEIPGQTFQTLKAKNPNILYWPIANSSINKNPGKIKQVEGWN